MRIFTPPRMRTMLQGLGMAPGEAIEHRWVTRAIETAQRKVEAHNFDIRKNLLEYDNVANDQRKAIYDLRDELMGSERVTAMVDRIRPDVINAIVDANIPPQSVVELWDVPGLEEAMRRDFGLELPIAKWLDEDGSLNEKGLRERLIKETDAAYNLKKEQIGASVLEHFEKSIMLQVLDGLWREHLAAVDYLRQGIHLRGYAQKDPKQEYKREAFTMFNDILARFKHEVITLLARVRVQSEQEVEAMEEERRKPREMQFQHAEAASAVEQVAEGEPAAAPRTLEAVPEPVKAAPIIRDQPKVGRNDPCPCGSGKKYKQCHGALA
jgi:preprotein translocase subunit SecA